MIRRNFLKFLPSLLAIPFVSRLFPKPQDVFVVTSLDNGLVGYWKLNGSDVELKPAVGIHQNFYTTIYDDPTASVLFTDKRDTLGRGITAATD